VKTLRERNWKPLPVKPGELDAVLLTHAHIDHSGYLPVLVRDGLRGRVRSTPPTRDLCAILLPDSGHLQEEDAKYANRKGFSRHRSAQPLYTREDGNRALGRFTPADLGQEFEVGELLVKFQPAGHILGAASILVKHRGKAVLFSGDLGRSDDLLMRAPAKPQRPDWIVVESTYGNRLHPRQDPLDALEEAARPCLERGGVLLIPSFAVGRAQTLLYCFHQLFARKRLRKVPVYLNSPMAVDATGLYRRHADYHRLASAECDQVCDVAEFVNSVEESKELNRRSGPMVVISASGMLTGGRVLHHLKAFAPDPKNTILLPGYQPPGTRGHALVEGATLLKVHGDYVTVRSEVQQIDVFSAHADQGELLEWLGACERPPREVFITHGEPVSSDALRLRIKDELGYRARAVEHGEQVRLE
jgi:metallo-beta-lactamase family protein